MTADGLTANRGRARRPSVRSHAAEQADLPGSSHSTSRSGAQLIPAAHSCHPPAPVVRSRSVPERAHSGRSRATVPEHRPGVGPCVGSFDDQSGAQVFAGASVPTRAWACWILGVVAAGVAVLAWLLPWDAFDSQCTLATRNSDQIRGACAAGAAARMPWFVVLVVAVLILLASGAVLAVRNRR